jgi:hypothetical protein
VEHRAAVPTEAEMSVARGGDVAADGPVTDHESTEKGEL